jgi:Flp pilus assembly protein TadG
MKAILDWCRFAVRGFAAVEFAIALPILMLFLAGVSDFGIIYYRQSCLSTAIAAGAEYAMLTDIRNEQSSGPALTVANIQTVMVNAAAQSMPNITVSAVATDPTLCYCMTGSSPNSTLTAAATCTSTCASGAAPTRYVELTVTHLYTPLLPLYSMLNANGTTRLTKTAWVPLQ